MRKILRTSFSIALFFFSAVSCNNHDPVRKNSTDLIADTLVVPKDSATLYYPVSIISEGKELKWTGNKRNSEILFALHEPVLANYTGDREIFRFTWIRSFDNPISIRIQKEDDNIKLILKVSTKAGYDKPWQIITDKTIPVSIADWNNFTDRLERIDFWNLASTDLGNQGNDGAEWILEGVTKDKYQFITRWSPAKSEYADCCKYLLELSKIAVPKEQGY